MLEKREVNKALKTIFEKSAKDSECRKRIAVINDYIYRSIPLDWYYNWLRIIDHSFEKNRIRTVGWMIKDFYKDNEK